MARDIGWGGDGRGDGGKGLTGLEWLAERYIDQRRGLVVAILMRVKLLVVVDQSE